MGRRSTAALPPGEQIDRFIYRVRDLQKTRFLRSEHDFGLDIRYTRTEGLSVLFQEPDEDDLKAFIITFRLFMLNNDPVNLHHIYDLCEQHITSDEVRLYLREARKQWKQALQSMGIKFNWRGEELTPEVVTILWMGFYAHTDGGSFYKLRDLMPIERALQRHMFLNCLMEGTRQVFYVAQQLFVARNLGLLDTSRRAA